MKYIFFLIVGLFFISGFASAFAQVFEEGSNYQKERIDLYNIKAILYSYDRIFVDNEWKVYNYIDDSNQLIFESEKGTFKFDKITCDFAWYTKGILNEDNLIGNYNTKFYSDSKEIIESCNFSDLKTNDYGISFVMNNNEVSRIFNITGINGMQIIDNYKTNNIGKSINYTTIEECIGCKADRIENNVIYFGNNYIDTENSQHNSLQNIKQIGNSTVITYQKIVKDKETFTRDPTFGYTSGTHYNSFTSTASGTSCPSPSGVDGLAYLHLGDSDLSDNCRYPAIRWDITSITDGYTITDVDVRYDVTEVHGDGSKTCEWKSIESDPAGETATQLRDDVLDGTTFATSSDCRTVTNNYLLDLGSSADSDLQANLGVNWWAVGVRFDSMTRTSASDFRSLFGAGSAVELQVVYTNVLPPNAVEDLTAVSTSATSIFLDWSEPDLNGETLIGYQINKTTSSPPNTVLVNNTGTSTSNYNATGLSVCTNYYFRVSAWTLGGVNTTGNIANATTSCGDVPDAPTLGAVALSETEIRFTSVAGASPGNGTVTYYGLRCEENNVGGWLDTVSNSTLPVDRRYEYTGLVFGDMVTCQWRDGSSFGWSDWSNNATAQTELTIIQAPRAPHSNPLYLVIDWIDAKGGLYFGLSVIPLAVMLIGLLATPKTTHIFTLAMLFVMGILHGSGLYVYPDWYWAMSILLGFVLVLGRREK